MTISANQYVAVYSIKNVMQAISVIRTIVLRTEAYAKEFIMDFLIGG